MIKIVIADDEVVIARGIEKLLNLENIGIDVVGVYNDGQEALDGILENKPDVALLDIQMPQIDGISILKRLNDLDIDTKVIFISGFQDFKYARSALKYGAVDYLLKPVIVDELHGALEKVVKEIKIEKNKEDIQENSTEYLIFNDDEETCFTVVIIDISIDNSIDEDALRLLKFSLSAFLNRYMEDGKNGIFITKNNDKVLVLKTINEAILKERLEDLQTHIFNEFGLKVSYITSNIINKMSDIPVQYEKCVEYKKYLFFVDSLKSTTIKVDELIVFREVKSEELEECRLKIQKCIIESSEERMKVLLSEYANLVLFAANGRKESAVFHYCTLLKEIERNLRDLKISSVSTPIETFLKIGRSCDRYLTLIEKYEEQLNIYVENTHIILSKNSNRELLIALDYINENLNEKLTLEILAGIVHMSPFYFSTFFKKQMGVNFKEYLNKIRLEKAVKLLLSSDMTSTEIVNETGFRDVRYYNEIFLKTYGVPPTLYKKSIEK